MRGCDPLLVLCFSCSPPGLARAVNGGWCCWWLRVVRHGGRKGRSATRPGGGGWHGERKAAGAAEGEPDGARAARRLQNTEGEGGDAGRRGRTGRGTGAQIFTRDLRIYSGMMGTNIGSLQRSKKGNTMFTINANNDTGSLKVGTLTGIQHQVGDKIRIQGEGKVRTVTYVMGKGEKQHLCFKGQGPLPLGEISFEVLGEAQSEQQAA